MILKAVAGLVFGDRTETYFPYCLVFVSLTFLIFSPYCLVFPILNDEERNPQEKAQDKAQEKSK